MAQVDTSIYNALGTRPRSIGEYTAELDNADLRKQGMQQNALALQTGQMGLQDRQRAMREAETIRNALSGLGPQATDDQRINALKATGLPGGYQQADALVKTGLERQKTATDVGKTETETQKVALETALKKQGHIAQLAGTATDQASWDRAIQLAGYIGADVSKIPPQFDPVVAKQLAQTALTSQQQLEQRLKEVTFAEQVRHNKAGEGLTARGQNITARGQDMADSRTRDLTQVTKENAAANRQEAADEKAVNKYSSTLQKEGIPELESAVAGAEAVMNKYQKGQVPGIGAVKNALPAAMMSDEGKDTRQALAQVRNIVLSARSGAAVTDQELRRLVEEIGTGAGMSEDDIRKGLARVRERLESIKTNAAAGVSDGVKATYEDRGGIKVKRGGSTPPAGGLPADIVDLLKKHGK